MSFTLTPSTGFPVIDHLVRLVAFDTTNDGSGSAGPDTASCIAYIKDVFGSGTVIHTGPDDSHDNLVVRVKGQDSSLAPIVVHSHVDVVPANRAAWDTDPFRVVDREGVLYGRGVVDMKNFIAYCLAAVERWESEGLKPRRDLVFAFFSDEECGGFNGSHQVVAQHPELFEGAEFSLGEGGGYSDGQNMLVSVGERGVGAVTITAQGVTGHASMPDGISAISRLTTIIPLLQDSSGDASVPASVPDNISTDLLELLLEGSRNRVTATVLSAGSLPNVSPGEATANFDVRMAPGQDVDVLTRLQDLVPVEDFKSEILSMHSVGDPHDMGVPTVIEEVMADHGHRVVPYFFLASTDAKHLSAVVPRNYGFLPTPGFNAHSHMHSDRECIPVKSLVDGGQIFDEVLLKI